MFVFVFVWLVKFRLGSHAEGLEVDGGGHSVCRRATQSFGGSVESAVAPF